MTQEKIIDRIKKLLAQSTSDNEHEAASAAAMAQELILKHEISEAALLEDTKPLDEVIDFKFGDETRAYAWRINLASGVCEAFGCYMYYKKLQTHVGPQKSQFYAIGTDSAKNAVAYMFAYLSKEVKRLANVAWKREAQEYKDSDMTPPSAHGWKNSFRLGASAIIAQRLHAQRRKTFREAKKDTSNSTALVRIDKQHALVKAEYEGRNMGSTSAGRDERTKGRGGYEAGQAAGRKVNIDGGRGPKAPSAQLKGRK